jgi:putative ABC transport system substrate-binding protein
VGLLTARWIRRTTSLALWARSVTADQRDRWQTKTCNRQGSDDSREHLHVRFRIVYRGWSVLKLGRTRLATVFILVHLAVPLGSGAQSAAESPRLGFLSSSSSERDKPRLAAFLKGLRELGYLEGRSIFIERRYAEGRFEILPELAAELVRLKVVILVVSGAPASTAARSATSVIPIVMTDVADPVGIGLVTSLPRPGGNVTGLSDFNAGVVAKRLELLKELLPSASRVGVLLNPANPSNPLQLKLTQAAAPTLGVTLLPLEARAADDIDRAFTAMREERTDALLVFGDPMLGSHNHRIVELAARARLPAMYSRREMAEAGGLMSYGTNFTELSRRAATYVDISKCVGRVNCSRVLMG